MFVCTLVIISEIHTTCIHALSQQYRQICTAYLATMEIKCLVPIQSDLKKFLERVFFLCIRKSLWLTQNANSKLLEVNLQYFITFFLFIDLWFIVILPMQDARNSIVMMAITSASAHPDVSLMSHFFLEIECSLMYLWGALWKWNFHILWVSSQRFSLLTNFETEV